MYQHIQIQGANGGVPVGPSSDPQNNPHGSFVDLCFDHHVPELTAQQVRDLLAPVLDFHAKSKQEAYLDSVPPKVKEAIQNHHVLVGMNQEMVVYAKGRPPKKVRERDGETEYEEWIYGEPPGRGLRALYRRRSSSGCRTMKVGGEKSCENRKGSGFLISPTNRQRNSSRSVPRMLRVCVVRGKTPRNVPRPASGPANTRPAPPMSDPSPKGESRPGRHHAFRSLSGNFSASTYFFRRYRRNSIRKTKRPLRRWDMPAHRLPHRDGQDNSAACPAEDSGASRACAELGTRFTSCEPKK